ncbi:MAG: hypothetical protein U0457_19810 [Candidatus Sericytochromatia bacterium]
MLLTAIIKEKQDLIDKGKIDGIEITAINMIKKNFDNQTINEITNLSIEKIESLRNTNHLES